jgi:hypothetical protein
MSRRYSPSSPSPAPRRLWLVLAAGLSLLCHPTVSVLAQESGELRLGVHRDWGYGNGNQIQGRFTLEASGPSDLASVMFMIDESIIGEVTSPPFKIQFDTDDYAPGPHTLSAVGRSADGRTLTSPNRRFEFVSAEAAWQSVQRILLITFGLVGSLIVVMITVQFIPAFAGNKKHMPPGAPRSDSLLGSAVCPKCRRPFALHWWGFNLGFDKYDRCDRCGRWSLVRRATPEQLAAAEAGEPGAAQPEQSIVETTSDEKLKRQLDDSRYRDQV